jgi:hypothetical protein
VPSPPRPDKPRTDGPEGEPSGGSPCPGRSRREDHGDRRHHHRDGDRGRWVGSPRDNDADEHRQDDDHRPNRHRDRADHGGSDGDYGSDDNRGSDGDRGSDDDRGSDGDRRSDDDRGYEGDRQQRP